MYIDSALLISEKVFSKSDINYVDIKLDHALLLIKLRRYDKAFKSIVYMRESTESLFGTDSYHNLRAWLLKSMLDQALDNYQQALDIIFYIESVAKGKQKHLKIYAESQIEHLKLLKKMGLIGIGFPSPYNDYLMGANYFQRVNTRRIDLIDSTISLVHKSDGNDSPLLPYLMCEKGYVTGLNGDLDATNELYDKNLPLLKLRYDSYHPEYRRQLQNLGFLNHIYNNTKTAANNFIEANDLLITEIKDAFTYSTEVNRKSFLKEIEYQFDKVQQFDYNHIMQNKKSLS
ncbi:hypothetical protein OAD66_01855 [Bacteroidia bacterium]|nr:hypothetical protein [Bacteroidia bacterium]